MTVSSRVFGENTHRGRSWVAQVVKDMRSMGYRVVQDGKTVLFDDEDALECIERRARRRYEKHTGRPDPLIERIAKSVYITNPCPSPEGQKGGS